MLGRLGGRSEGVASNWLRVWSLFFAIELCSSYDVPDSPDMSTEDILCVLSTLANFSSMHWYTQPLSRSNLTSAPHSKCAVISNSGLLNRLQHGKDIDKADFVIRFNDAPVRGYEANVGAKDDLRLMNNLFAEGVVHPTDENSFSLPLSEDVIYLAFPETHTDVESVRELMQTHPQLQVFAADLGLQSRLTTLIQGIYPSGWFGLGNNGEHWTATTGAAGMVIAMSLCDEVRAYGMAASDQEHKFHYHYYDEGPLTVLDWHADENFWHKTFSAEKDLWKRLASNGGADVEASDVAIIPGFSKLACSAEQLDVSDVDRAAILHLQEARTMGQRAGADNSLANIAQITDLRMFKTDRYPPQNRLWRELHIIVAIAVASLLPIAVSIVACLVCAGRKDLIIGSETASEEAALPSGSGPLGMSWMACLSLLLYLVLLVATDIFANQTAQNHGGQYPWCPTLVVFLVEFSKFIVSIGLVVLDRCWECFGLSAPQHFLKDGRAIPLAAGETPEEMQALKAGSSTPQSEADTTMDVTPSRSKLWGEACVRLVPVAASYAGNNCLVLFALSQIRLDAYVVWRNSAILFNALLWSCYFQRPLQRHHALAVVALFIGCSLDSCETNGKVSFVGRPVVLVLCAALLSALAAVLNEGVLKNDRFKVLGLNSLNVLLYAQTSGILFLCLAWRMQVIGESYNYIVFGFDGSAIGIILMQTALGLVISRVLKYTSAVAKTMVSGSREIVTVFVAPFFVVSRLDWISVSSTLWVFFSILLYFLPQRRKA